MIVLFCLGSGSSLISSNPSDENELETLLKERRSKIRHKQTHNPIVPLIYRKGNVVISHNGLPPVKKDKNKHKPSIDPRIPFIDRDGNVVISHHGLPPVKKDKSEHKPAIDPRIPFIDREGNVVISHHALPPVKKDKSEHKPTISPNFVDREGNMIISRHVLPPVKKDQLKSISRNVVLDSNGVNFLYGDRRNLVQFRDSNNHVIATITDPHNSNNANVTLSKQDDRNRFIQEIHSIGVAKHEITSKSNKRNFNGK